MAEKTYNLDLSLGLKTFHVRFAEFDETVDILFNPTDADLPRRLIEARNRVEAAVNDLNGESTEDFVAATTRVNNAMCEAVDFAFGSKISDKIFLHCSPLALTDGKPFIVQFFEKITPAIQSAIEAEGKKVSTAAKKYVEKYEK